MTSWIYTIPIAFLAGTIPFGLLIARAKGVDIRKVGSGNIGATNVGRALGRKYFLLCFALDFLKGFAPVLVAGRLAGLIGPVGQRGETGQAGQTGLISPQDAWLWLACMLAPVLGHVFSPWLRFKGGKGVATALGAILAVWPYLTLPGLAAFLVFFVVLKTIRFMSVASMAAAVCVPVFGVVFWTLLARGARLPGMSLEDGTGEVWSSAIPFLGVSTLLAGLVVWTHRGNIARLRAGTEPRFGARVGRKVEASEVPAKAG